MKTILHLIPTLEGGGAERQMAMLAIEQSKRGWDVHVARRRGGVHELALRAGGVTVHALGDLPGLHPWLLRRLISIVRRIRPDILQSWLPQMDFMAGIVARVQGIPWVLCERASELAYMNAIAAFRARRLLGRTADAIIANSAEGAAYWAGARPGSTDVAVVANALDVEGVRRAAPVPRRDAADGELTILFVGRLVPQKAPEIFVQAVAHLSREPRLHALIIGDGPLLGEVRAGIDSLGLTGRVSVVPYEADWWGLLKTAAALVSPSRFEGQPNVVLEAMAARCPLVVSGIPTHRAILDESSALIVPVDDPVALAAAIEAVLLDPVAARARAEVASERTAELTIQATADGYERVYGRVLRRRVA